MAILKNMLAVLMLALLATFSIPEYGMAQETETPAEEMVEEADDAVEEVAAEAEEAMEEEAAMEEAPRGG